MTTATGDDTRRDDELLRKYEPIIRYTAGEYFLPASVESFVGSCELMQRDQRGGIAALAGRGEVDVDRLANVGATATGLAYLSLAVRPLTRGELVVWRLRRDRPRFTAGSRLGHVGVLSRLVDALNRASLVVRGSVAGGSEAAAETEYRPHLDDLTHPYYARVTAHAGFVVLQYWYFYFFNDWRSRANGVNDHEGDWEQVTIFLAEQATGPPVPAWVAFSAHDEVGDDLRRRWDDPDLTLVDDHPVVFAGLGSHSGAYLGGDYLISVERSSIPRVVHWVRRFTRLLLPWTRGSDLDRIGIPYVDYARGNGHAIGAGCERSWSPVRIDDDTPWIRDYKGLWGADIEDPFGGERGPAGPRYERDGRVRDSWADPVGWAGLEKIAPNEQDRERLVRERIDEIDGETHQLLDEEEPLRRRLRTDVAAGRLDTTVDERRMRELTAKRVALDDDRRRLMQSLTAPPEAGNPHAHLRHRRVPLPATIDGRRRVLQIFAAVSTPLVLVTIGLMFLPYGRSAVVIGVAGLVVISALEAIARGRLLAYVSTLAIAVVVAAVILAVVIGLIVEWRLTIAAVLFTAAAIVLIFNLSELRRS
jgi:hypothetical protein